MHLDLWVQPVLMEILDQLGPLERLEHLDHLELLVLQGYLDREA